MSWLKFTEKHYSKKNPKKHQKNKKPLTWDNQPKKWKIFSRGWEQTILYKLFWSMYGNNVKNIPLKTKQNSGDL